MLPTRFRAVKKRTDALAVGQSPSCPLQVLKPSGAVSENFMLQR
jgi:hypothetical protein